MAGTIGASRDASYSLYDNDADNFDPLLNSSSAAYYSNPGDGGETYGEDRWKTGGGVDTGEAKGIMAGRTRDTDGTVDRVRDPPREVLPLLYALKCQAEAYNISIQEAFVAAGGTTYGTIPATKFGSCLVVTFHRLGLTQAQVDALTFAYGVENSKVLPRSSRSKVQPFEMCGWMDLCEDVGKVGDIYAAETGGMLPDTAARIYPRGVKY